MESVGVWGGIGIGSKCGCFSPPASFATLCLNYLFHPSVISSFENRSDVLTEPEDEASRWERIPTGSSESVSGNGERVGVSRLPPHLLWRSDNANESTSSPKRDKEHRGWKGFYLLLKYYVVPFFMLCENDERAVSQLSPNISLSPISLYVVSV